ncbi:MAG: AAA family ATPase [Solirubrobacteraceae bacterium]|nr:AAA family ATPase [Solirubrobacteraceae bacterium]
MAITSTGRQGSDAGGWPLVGRARELEEIERAVQGNEAGVVLAAPAGVGKSRLAREAVASAESAGAFTQWVQATRSAAAVALGACAELVPDDARTDDTLDVMRRSAAALRERAGGRPVVVGVDDAQLLDPASAALVLHLVVTSSATVVVTIRSGEPCPDAITSLWKDAGARRLDLGELGEADTHAFVDALVGGPVEEEAWRWVYDTSRGNALYARELVGSALDRGALELVAGLWRMPDRPPVSSTLTELVAGRLVDLDESGRRLLELLAIGEPLQIGELSQLVGEPALVAAEERGLIAVGAGEEVLLAHPLYGETIAADLPPLRGRELRRRLVSVVEQRRPPAPGDQLRLARWRVETGDEVPTELLVDGAHAAITAGDPELAARLAQMALDAGAGAEAALLLGRAHLRRSRFEEAEEVFASVESLLSDEDLAIDYLHRRAGLLYWNLFRGDDVVALLERAADWWPGERWRQRMAAMEIYPLLVRGGLGGSPEEMGELLANPDLDRAARRQLEPMHVGLLFYNGRAREAFEIASAAEPSPPLSGLDEQAMLSLASAVSIDGGFDWEGVRRRREAIFLMAVRGHDHAAAGLAASWLGHAHVLAGRLDEGQRWLAESEWHFERHDVLGQLAITRALLVTVLAERGDEDGAVAMLSRAHDALGGHDPLPVQRPYLDVAAAQAARAAHDPPRAQALLMDSAAAHEAMPIQAAWLWHEAVRAGAPAKKILPPLSMLAERCDAPMVDVFVTRVRALAEGDGRALVTAAERFEEIGALRFAVEAAVDAANVFVEAGRQDSARQAAVRARALHERGQGGTLPDIPGLDGAAVVLTARETQLVELARQGLSNAEIADRLVLSVRTVESHLYRAMGKLGISDRRDL